MALSQQQLVADWVYLDKIDRTFTLTEKYKAKVDAIPGVVNDLNSTSTTDALSAAMWRTIKDKLDELSSIGSFLSVWDCTLWLPQTDPLSEPYYYAKWDYYIVWRIGTKNYKPYDTVYYAGVPSITLDANPDLATWDQYMFDWKVWTYIPSGWRVIVVDDKLLPDSTNPVENRAIYEEMSKKALVTDVTALQEEVAKKQDASVLATVAKTGKFTDLDPTSIPVYITTKWYDEWSTVTSQAPSAKAIYDKIYSMWGTVDEKAEVTYWTTEPTNPRPWDIFVNSADGSLKIWDGNEWTTIASEGYVNEKVQEQADALSTLSSTVDAITPGANAWATAIQPGANITELINNANYIDNTVDSLTNYTKTSDLAWVALSGSYNDLDPETLPTIGDATLTITQNGTPIGTFSANSTQNVSINIEDKWDDIVYVTSEEYDRMWDEKYSDWKTYFIYI